MSDVTIDRTPTCRVVRAGAEFVGKQGHLCAPAISAQSVGAQKIHLQIVRIPPGAFARAHKHGGHETALLVLSGQSGMWYGDKLDKHLVAGAAGVFFIPPPPPPPPL